MREGIHSGGKRKPMSSRIEESGRSGGKKKERRDGDQSALSRMKEKNRENRGERSRHS